MKLPSLRVQFVSRLTLAAVISFFLLYLLTATLTGSVHAQDACNQEPLSPQETVDFLNRCAIERDIFDDKMFNLNQMIGTTDSLNTLLLGTSFIHPQTNVVTQRKGAVTALGGWTASLYAVPPASGVEYFAQQIHKFNPVQPAYAQQGTIGWAALGPVQKLWQVFRNMAYVGFVIVFVIIGFMILFRARLSPQTVANVQDSIPRIVVALILVTFSFAIAGLFIDAMFLFLNIVLRILDLSGLIDFGTAENIVFGRSIFGIIADAWTDIIGAVAKAIHAAIEDTLNLSIVGVSFPGIFNDIVGWGIGGIAAVIVAVAALFVMFRIFLTLLMSYVTIIILTMVAPFFFLIQALPGNNGAKEWFKQMAANVAVFPTAALMIIFAGILTGLKDFGGTTTFIPEAETVKFPLLASGLQVGTITKLVGIGFLLVIPDACNMVKNAITGGRGGGAFGGLGAGAGTALGAAGGLALSSGRRGMNIAAGTLPSGYDREGNVSRNPARFMSPAYWKQRGVAASIRREDVGRKIAGVGTIVETGARTGRRPAGEGE